MAVKTGDRVKFVSVEGSSLPSTVDDSAIYFLKGSQELFVGTQMISNVLNVDFINHNAGYHNSIYRGKNLGTSVTAEQYAEIRAGTFKDLYIGDYWVINGVNWRIAAFDYYYNTGDTACTKHHVVLVPDTSLYTAQMHNTASGEYESGFEANTTVGAYVGSDMYKTNLETAKTKIYAAFGEAHVMQHRQYLQNAVSSGHPSGGAWVNSKVELMTEENVYGCKIFGPMANGSAIYNNYTIDKSQYPLFTLNPYMISNRQWYWLRDVVSSDCFAYVDDYGSAYYGLASFAYGVRPAFSIIA